MTKQITQSLMLTRSILNIWNYSSHFILRHLWWLDLSQQWNTCTPPHSLSTPVEQEKMRRVKGRKTVERDRDNLIREGNRFKKKKAHGTKAISHYPSNSIQMPRKAQNKCYLGKHPTTPNSVFIAEHGATLYRIDFWPLTYIYPV